MPDFQSRRHLFSIPDGVVYLDGNSLGPLPNAASKRIANTVEKEWGIDLIRAWNTAGWIDWPANLGDRIAPLVGATPGTVTVGDTLSIRIFQVLAAALRMRPDRNVILTDSGNFPSDIYMADGLARLVNDGHRIEAVEPEAVADRLVDDVAVLMLTHVDYRTGRMHDMAELTGLAHEVGALTIWDLAHSAGAVPVDLDGAKADFAAGCTYKYLNGGPGSPGFVYVRPDHIETVEPALSGWLGHADPFAFELDYTPAKGRDRMRIGTPSVIALAALDAALDAWSDVDMRDVRQRSIELTQLFIDEMEARIPEAKLVSPRAAEARGSHVSFSHPEGYALMQALIARGVIGDFRAPDMMRFGIAPLYNTKDDIRAAVTALKEILESGEWDQDRFKTRAAVT